MAPCFVAVFVMFSCCGGLCVRREVGDSFFRVVFYARSCQDCTEELRRFFIVFSVLGGSVCLEEYTLE